MSKQSSMRIYQPDCPLAHLLINKLSTVVGNCDLVLEGLAKDSPLLPRMTLVRDTARSMAADLAKFQCELAERRVAEQQKSAVV